MSSIASTSESSNGVTAATPALLTSAVMPASVRSNVSILREIGLVVEIGCDDANGSAGLVAEAFCQIVEAPAIARHKDQIVAAPGKAIGIDCADA